MSSLAIVCGSESLRLPSEKYQFVRDIRIDMCHRKKYDTDCGSVHSGDREFLDHELVSMMTDTERLSLEVKFDVTRFKFIGKHIFSAFLHSQATAAAARRYFARKKSVKYDAITLKSETEVIGDDKLLRDIKGDVHVEFKDYQTIRVKIGEKTEYIVFPSKCNVLQLICYMKAKAGEAEFDWYAMQDGKKVNGNCSMSNLGKGPIVELQRGTKLSDERILVRYVVEELKGESAFMGDEICEYIRWYMCRQFKLPMMSMKLMDDMGNLELGMRKTVKELANEGCLDILLSSERVNFVFVLDGREKQRKCSLLLQVIAVKEMVMRDFKVAPNEIKNMFFSLNGRIVSDDDTLSLAGFMEGIKVDLVRIANSIIPVTCEVNGSIIYKGCQSDAYLHDLVEQWPADDRRFMSFVRNNVPIPMESKISDITTGLCDPIRVVLAPTVSLVTADDRITGDVPIDDREWRVEDLINSIRDEYAIPREQMVSIRQGDHQLAPGDRIVDSGCDFHAPFTVDISEMKIECDTRLTVSYLYLGVEGRCEVPADAVMGTVRATVGEKLGVTPDALVFVRAGSRVNIEDSRLVKSMNLSEPFNVSAKINIRIRCGDGVIRHCMKSDEVFGDVLQYVATRLEVEETEVRGYVDGVLQDRSTVLDKIKSEIVISYTPVVAFSYNGQVGRATVDFHESLFSVLPEVVSTLNWPCDLDNARIEIDGLVIDCSRKLCDIGINKTFVIIVGEAETVTDELESAFEMYDLTCGVIPYIINVTVSGLVDMNELENVIRKRKTDMYANVEFVILTDDLEYDTVIPRMRLVKDLLCQHAVIAIVKAEDAALMDHEDDIQQESESSLRSVHDTEPQNIMMTLGMADADSSSDQLYRFVIEPFEEYHQFEVSVDIPVGIYVKDVKIILARHLSDKIGDRNPDHFSVVFDNKVLSDRVILSRLRRGKRALIVYVKDQTEVMFITGKA